MSDVALVGGPANAPKSGVSNPPVRQGPESADTAPRESKPDLQAVSLKRETDIDPETKTVVLRWIDEQSGSVQAQLPTEAQMQLRAYLVRQESDLPVRSEAGKIV